MGQTAGVPHPLVALAAQGIDLAKGALPLRFSPPVPSTARWSAARAKAWQDDVGWLVGCNFTPSTAGNQLELWQADTFDPATIDRELGWAADLGFTSIRLFLHDLLFELDGDAFLDRIDRVLDLAAGHGIGVMPVLFDGVWHPHPRPGPQPEPRPGVHNSTWVQGPGAAVLADPRRWDSLRPYVEAVVGRFATDERVHAWDLFNEPDQRNSVSWGRYEIPHKTARADGLLNRVFDWCQAIDPTQPLTAGVFVGVSGAVERVSRINRTMLSRSDVISFHCYSPRPRLEATIDHLEGYGRPLLCTEWMARTIGSTVDLIDVFADRGVGAYCWGLVDGRTQTRFAWTSWVRPAAPDAPWFHELLHPDGTPYDEAEAARLRAAAARVRGGGRGAGGGGGGGRGRDESRRGAP